MSKETISTASLDALLDIAHAAREMLSAIGPRCRCETCKIHDARFAPPTDPINANLDAIALREALAKWDALPEEDGEFQPVDYGETATAAGERIAGA